MENILVLSGDYSHQENRAKFLRDSAAAHGLPLHILGIDEQYPQWPGGKKTIQRAVDFLKDRPERYVVVTDAFDVLVTRWNAQELVMLIDSAPCPIMSVEFHVWPAGPWQEAYKHLEGRYLWFGINGGQYCGRREDIIQMWQEMISRWNRGQELTGNNSQQLLHMMYADWFMLNLDLECRIFQSMFGPHDHLIGVKDGKAYNTVTGAYPMFLHFNGGQRGIERWAQVLAPAYTS